MRPAAFVDFRCISLDPAPDTTGVHLDAAFGHQLGHVFISQGVLEVPTDALHDHLTGKMTAFEGIGGRDRHAPPRYQTPPANFATDPILAVVRRVHRKPLMGSPAVSGSSSLSISAITSGFFFSPSCVRPRLGVLSPPPRLLPTTPAVPGPPCAHPLPETPLSCGLHARVFELPSPHRDVDAAHPASCGTA